MTAETNTTKRRRRKWVMLAALVLFAWPAWEGGRVLLGDNVHTVVPGEVYRGAQQSPEELERLCKKLGIRTVVNLRGLCNPNSWYMDQCRTLQHLGISQIDLGLSANRLPPAQEMRHLVEIIDEVEYPIFFHCRRGADRTGLASVVAKILKTGCGWNEGRRQLHWRYGHVAVGRVAFMDRFFELYQEWLTKSAREHSKEAFRHWVLHEYDGGWCAHEVLEFKRVPTSGKARCVPKGEPIVYHVKLRNTSVGTWSITPFAQSGVHLGYRVFDVRGVTVMEGRAPLKEEEIVPGANFASTLIVPGQLPPGKYRIVIDLVDAAQGWFYQMGAEPMEGELDIGE